MRRAHLLRTALTVAVLATALAPLGSTAQVPKLTRCPDEARRTRPDGWLALSRPAWSRGGQEVKHWAVSPFVSGYALASNGDTVARSLDGGCSWDEVYSAGVGYGETVVISFGNSVHGVALPPSPPGRLPYTAWALVSDTTTRVVTSSDLGETWNAQPSAGLPAIVQLHSIHVGADPRIAYVLADWQSTLTSLTETTLYVTRDGGVSFQPVQRGLDPSQYTQIAVDPVDPRQLWAWDEDALYHSKDSGATFASIDDVKGPISTVDVSHFPAFAPARIVAYRKDKAAAQRSDDGGVTWRDTASYGRVTGTANLYDVDALATTSSLGVFIDAPTLKISRRNVSLRQVVPRDLQWARGLVDLVLYAGNGKDLYLRRFTPQFVPRKPPKLPPVELRGGALIKQGPTSLKPLNEIVRLRPGERKKVEYTLNLSPVPTPLDIFFATDSTGSMSGVIESLRRDLQDIIDDLGDSGIDVYFGVGDFKDYPHFGAGSDHPYKRFRAVGPIDDELERAIEAIQIGGGNGLDSALTATYQAATGEGQRRIDGADQAGYWVEPGQGAEWRPEALKVLVIAADVRSRDPQNDAGYPGPSYRTVINALNRLGIEHVGLAVGNNPEEPFQSLSRVSRGTNTVAPRGGTDCDDDGDIDVREGFPLVCKLGTESNGKTNLTPAMVGLLTSLEDLQPVAMSVMGDRRVARVAGPAVHDSVNVKAYNSLRFSVEARCDVDTAGETYKMNVRATVLAKTVASTPLTVVCAGLPPRPQPEFPPAPVRVLVAAAVPPPPPPPAPVPQTQPQPNPNPNPNPNPQPVTQVNVGMAHQEQTEVALALAHAEVQIEEVGELAMSGLQDGDAARAGAALCTGMVMASCAAVALRRRTRPQTAKVRSSG